MLSVLELVELWHGNGAEPCHKPEIVAAMLTVLQDPTVEQVVKQLQLEANDADDMKVVQWGFQMWEKAGKGRL